MSDEDENTRKKQPRRPAGEPSWRVQDIVPPRRPGRPRKRPALPTIQQSARDMLFVGQQPITLTIDGKRRTMTMNLAILMNLARDACRGKPTALKLYMELRTQAMKLYEADVRLLISMIEACIKETAEEHRKDDYLQTRMLLEALIKRLNALL